MGEIFPYGRNLFLNSSRKEEREEWFSKLLPEGEEKKIKHTSSGVYARKFPWGGGPLLLMEKNSRWIRLLPEVLSPLNRRSVFFVFYTFHINIYIYILQTLMNCGQEVKIWELRFEFKFIKVEYALTLTHIWLSIIIFNKNIINIV